MTNTIQNIIDLIVQIQQIPAPTFYEQKRAEFIRDRFGQEGLKNVEIDETGNVYGLLSKADRRPSHAKPLIISAHTDTVFPLDMDISARREVDKVHGIGVGDNSTGVAALIGLIWLIRERKIELPGDIWFVANVCEEGLGDLRGMKAVVDRFGENVLAYLILEGMALGHVYHRAVGVKRYRITARVRGGHSWSDYGQPSAIHELSRLVTRLTSLELPREPRTTMNVGKISGGTSINVIAPQASMELDLRSAGQETLEKLVSSVEKIIREANRPGIGIETESIGTRPAGEISAYHPLIELAEDCLHELGLEASLATGSTDANIPLNRGYPALVLGITTGSGAHTQDEYIDTMPVAQGMEQLVQFVRAVFNLRF